MYKGLKTADPKHFRGTAGTKIKKVRLKMSPHALPCSVQLCRRTRTPCSQHPGKPDTP